LEIAKRRAELTKNRRNSSSDEASDWTKSDEDDGGYF